MQKIILHGYKGKMGRVIERLVGEDPTMTVAAGIDPFAADGIESFPVFKSLSACTVPGDVIIDFSTAAAVPALLAYAGERKIPLVLCTTGLDSETTKKAADTANVIPLFKSANMSLGINLLANLLKKSAAILYDAGFDIEIIEKHHNQKIDAPSGTAILLADAVNAGLEQNLNYVYDRSSLREKRDRKDMGIQSIRGGTIVGEHSVLFAGNDEIVEFTHQAGSKEVFGVGAVNAAKFLAGKSPGLYDMQDLLNDYID